MQNDSVNRSDPTGTRGTGCFALESGIGGVCAGEGLSVGSSDSKSTAGSATTFGSPPAGWTNLPGGYSARVDVVPETDGMYEIHVYESSAGFEGARDAGQRSKMAQFERGVVGPDGSWLRKHSFSSAPNLPQTTSNAIRGMVAERARSAGWLGRPGSVNIKGGNLSSAIQQGMARSGSLRFLSRLGASLGVVGVVSMVPANFSDKTACANGTAQAGGIAEYICDY